MLQRASAILCLAISAITASGCFAVGMNSDYSGPVPRAADVDQYYSRGDSYSGFKEEVKAELEEMTIKHIKIASAYGEIKVDFYQRKEPSDDLVLVFPMLGGKNVVVDYFADYFAKRGFDSAIIHRNDDFKDPSRFHEIEKLLHDSVVRDRIALDFFEKAYGKKDFGSFGISRGAINVAMSAGVDKRLKYNVLALGATDLRRVFRTSNQSRIKKYRDVVIEKNNISEKDFYTFLHDELRTDPKFLVQHIDARDTLLFLALLDKTTPIQYGIKLRQQLGGPRTIYLLADHYTSVGYTQFVSIPLPGMDVGLFPFPYIESEALSFYREKFRSDDTPSGSLLPFRILQAPINLIADIVDSIF